MRRGLVRHRGPRNCPETVTACSVARNDHVQGIDDRQRARDRPDAAQAADRGPAGHRDPRRAARPVRRAVAGAQAGRAAFHRRPAGGGARASALQDTGTGVRASAAYRYRDRRPRASRSGRRLGRAADLGWTGRRRGYRTAGRARSRPRAGHQRNAVVRIARPVAAAGAGRRLPSAGIVARARGWAIAARGAARRGRDQGIGQRPPRRWFPRS